MNLKTILVLENLISTVSQMTKVPLKQLGFSYQYIDLHWLHFKLVGARQMTQLPLTRLPLKAVTSCVAGTSVAPGITGSNELCLLVCFNSNSGVFCSRAASTSRQLT
jgi:hypothetical protein